MKRKKFSIAAMLPVNVEVEAETKEQAIKFAQNNTYLEYEEAGDIVIDDNAHVVVVEEQ